MTEELLPGVGAAVSVHRRSAGVCQADLAGRIGRSVQWLTAVERGHRSVDRLGDLVAVATVLGCRVEDLLGPPVDPPGTPLAEVRSAKVAGVRSVLLGSTLPAAAGPAAAGPADGDDGPATDGVSPPSQLRQRVDQAWVLWHGSSTAHTELASVLPTLLGDALAGHQRLAGSTGSPGSVESAGALSAAWQITRIWLQHMREGDLAWVAADRAMTAARAADDPYLIAASAWGLSQSYRWAGQAGEAVGLCLRAAEELAPALDRPGPGILAAHGALHLAAAVGAAEDDDPGLAWQSHRAAQAAASGLGGQVDPWTAFGPAEVAAGAVAVHAALGDADAVVGEAARLDLGAFGSVQSRAAVLVDVAGAHVRRGEDQAAVLALLDAEQACADHLRHSVQPRELVRELWHRDHGLVRAHIRKLAGRIHLLA